MAAKRSVKKTAKKSSKKRSSQAKARTKKAAASAEAPPVEPSTEQATEAASDAIQSSLAETHRVIEANLASFRKELQSVQNFVERAVGDMQLNQADALHRAPVATEPTVMTSTSVPVGDQMEEAAKPPIYVAPSLTSEQVTGSIAAQIADGESYDLDISAPKLDPGLDLAAAMQATVACEENVGQSDIGMHDGEIALDLSEALTDLEPDGDVVRRIESESSVEIHASEE